MARRYRFRLETLLRLRQQREDEKKRVDAPGHGSKGPGATHGGHGGGVALGGFAAYLRDQVLPVAAGDFAVGRQGFDARLREEHMVDYDADELLATGWEQFHQTREQMAAVAAEIDPFLAAPEILAAARADHPGAGELLDAYRQEMAAIRQYVVDHEIATIPEGVVLRIVETPTYLQPIIPFAGYMPPGILEEKQEGIFVVTPVDPALPPEEQDERLRRHYRAKPGI